VVRDRWQGKLRRGGRQRGYLRRDLKARSQQKVVSGSGRKKEWRTAQNDEGCEFGRVRVRAVRPYLPRVHSKKRGSKYAGNRFKTDHPTALGRSPVFKPLDIVFGRAVKKKGSQKPRPKGRALSLSGKAVGGGVRRFILPNGLEPFRKRAEEREEEGRKKNCRSHRIGASRLWVAAQHGKPRLLQGPARAKAAKKGEPGNTSVEIEGGNKNGGSWDASFRRHPVAGRSSTRKNIKRCELERRNAVEAVDMTPAFLRGQGEKKGQKEAGRTRGKKLVLYFY